MTFTTDHWKKLLMFYILRIGEDNPLKVDPEEFKLTLKKYCSLKKYYRRLKNF
jgi:hypothetical protein